jgi:hypothetical protein
MDANDHSNREWTRMNANKREFGPYFPTGRLLVVRASPAGSDAEPKGGQPQMDTNNLDQPRIDLPSLVGANRALK